MPSKQIGRNYKNITVIYNMATKKATKKATPKKSSTEIVVRVESAPRITESDLVTPMTAGGNKMALSKTWVTSQQLINLVQKTPPQYIYKRPAKGGGEWSYVTGNYVEKVLNFVFGWNWDFEVVAHGKEGTQIWVHGKLTVKGPQGETITKSQFGRSDIKKLRSGEVLDFGNDLKAATTDALKKCASLLG